jgi:hypothetical protein
MVLTFVGYYRVSTVRQGQSGLGLDAQREAVERYLKGVGGALAISFLEVESGKRNDRWRSGSCSSRARRMTFRSPRRAQFFLQELPGFPGGCSVISFEIV